MNYIIIVTIFLLLTIVILRQEREKERFFWGKIIILFLSCILTFEIGIVRVPLGIIIAFFLTVKFSKFNISLKRLTLLFSLVVFILVNFVIPPIEFNNVLYSKEIHSQMSKFEDIEYVKVFANDAAIQNEIKKYDKEYSNIMFRTYMLMDKDIQIKDKEWLLYASDDELDYYWQSNTTESKSKQISETSSVSYGISWMEYIRDNNTGEEYIGVFEKEKGEVILKYVIKGELKSGQQPNSLF